MPGIPTYLVVDNGERVVLTRSAGVDRSQLVALFAEGERAFRGGGSGPDAAFEQGQKLAGAGQYKEAASTFERSLVGTPNDWPRRHAAVEALVLARQESGDPIGCAEVAERETRTGPRDAWWANLITMGMWCSLDAGLLSRDLEKRARAGLTAPELGDDDRSGLYEVVVEAGHDKALAVEWLAFLEKQAAAAQTPAERAVYDPHRLAAAIAAGDPGRAVAALQASERDLPADYNGPARLAIAYLEMGRYDDALAACDRALTKVYGPRRLRVEETRATALGKKGDLAGARRALEEALREAASLPSSPRSKAAAEHLKKLLGELH
jgi:hypothetical protein